MAATQKEVEAEIENQMEMVTPHMQRLKALFQQHMCAYLLAAQEGGEPSD
jgi:hypothetical protein